MSHHVNEKFQEWTNGFDPRQSRISVFEHIRDIPYSLSVRMTDPDIAPEKILTLEKGYCGPKHYLLAAMYRKLDLDVVYVTIPFLWNDPDLQYSPELRRLAAGMPVASHLACRVRIGARWVLVDATWDRPLVKAGFPINENWDGFADTKCAVKPLRSAVRTAFCSKATSEPYREGSEGEFHPRAGEQDHGDEDDHVRYYHDKTGMRTQEEIERIARFYSEFETWLVRMRG
jgi:hypothetical protein